jgi:hypothetical protein
MNIEQLKAARVTMPDGSDINDIGDWAFEHRNTIRTLLDNAINAPDLDATIAQCIEHARRDWKEGAFGYNEAEIVVDTVRLLAPRIVREGFICVPIDAPTQAMTNAWWKASNNKIPMHLPSYKAMIAASKGD